MTTMTDSRAVEGDVRGLVALAERVQYADTHAQVSKDDAGEFVCLPPWLWLEIRDAAVEALAAEGVQRWASDDQPVIEPPGFIPSHDSASAYVGFCPYCAEHECDNACPGPDYALTGERNG